MTEFHCCLCDERLWERYRDVSYYLDVMLIEKFHVALQRPVQSLSDLIELVSLYSTIALHIEQVINNCHKNCLRCAVCGHHMTVSVSAASRDNVLERAVSYYVGLDAVQAKVLSRLSNCITEMTAINQMIGMENIKEEFVRLMKFLATINPQELQDNSFLMHMVIMGPPGHGKTEVAKLLGNAFKKSGLLTADKFVIATRADLIGKYCGHTARETTAMFDKARGGVIFIDEVYALGNPEKRDVFTGECINTINQLLSERTDTLCIIAGYEEEIETCFFSYNPGLQRRFPWRFKIKQYTEEDLVRIFQKKMGDIGRALSPSALTAQDLKDHRDQFPNAGGDIVNLVTNCMLAYYDNSFLCSVAGRPLDRKDVQDGLKRYLSNRKKEVKSEPPFGMYI